MNLSGARSGSGIFPSIKKLNIQPSVLFAVIIFSALIAFEMFNYSTTDFALRDLLGELKFVGIRWSTILAIAFCGIDFAGIARLFTPEQGSEEPKEVWYLFGAWFLAATMNALLTWWGVAIAIATHNVQSSAVIDPSTLTRIVPVFVALMVWVIRILIIGSLSVAGDRLIWSHRQPARSRQMPQSLPVSNPSPRMTRPMNAAPRAAAPRNTMQGNELGSHRAEPTYHSLSASGGDPSNRFGQTRKM